MFQLALIRKWHVMIPAFFLFVYLLGSVGTAQGDILQNHPFEVYTDTDWAGNMCYSDAPESANIYTTCDNAISSIFLYAGWSARVYNGYNQTGSSVCINQTERTLGPGTYYDNSLLNDTISSFTLYNQAWCASSPTPAWPLEVYIDANYSNFRCYSSGPESAEIYSTCNDSITSVLLRPGWSVRFYRDAQQGGPSACFSANDSDLSNNTFSDGSPINDAITSFTLLQQAACDTVPPSGNITQPDDGSIFGTGTINLAAEAWDEVGGSGVNRVEFWVKYDGTWHQAGASDYTSPYSVNWGIPTSLDSQDIQIGLHVVDNAGNVAIDPGGLRTIHFIKTLWDTIPPGGNLTSPTDGVTVGPGSLYIAADAWDNVGGSGVNRVEFWVKYNGKWFSVKYDYEPPYSVNWEIPSWLSSQDIEIGTHIVDNVGNMSIDPGGKRVVHYENVLPDTTPPDGLITLPLNGVSVTPGTSVYLAALAWDNIGGSGVDRVEFWVKYNNEWHSVKYDYEAPYNATFLVPSSLSPQDIEIGTHIVDHAGNMATDPGGKRTIHCVYPPDNTPPSGNITAPANNSTIVGPTTLRLSADAWDNAGGSGVNRVEFWVKYDGNWHVAGNYDYVSPYIVDWQISRDISSQDIEIGTHIVDNAGNMAVDSGGKRTIHYVRSAGIDIPYIHQLWSTGDVFDGHYACGASSLGMLAAWYNKLTPTAPWGATGFESFWSPYSWYVINAFGGFTATGWDASCTGQYAGFYGASRWTGQSNWCGYYLAGWYEMSGAASSLGIGNSVVSPTAKNELITLVSSGKPVLLGTGLCKLFHIVLVIGYDANTDEFIVSDPYGKCNGYNEWNYDIYAYSREVRYGWEFMNAWSRLELTSPIPGWSAGLSLVDAYSALHGISSIDPSSGEYEIFTSSQGSIVPNEGNKYINQPRASFVLRIDNSDSQMSEMRFSDNGVSWSDWEPFKYVVDREFTAEEGTKVTYVEAKDILGNSMILSSTVILDTTPPTGTITLLQTDGNTILYRVSGSDDTSEVYRMIISQNPMFQDAKWGYFIGEAIYGSLEHGNMVYAKLMDQAGNVSGLITLEITNADFVASSRCGTELLTTTFIDNSVGDVLGRRWDFGDGNTSSEQNPIHTYINYETTRGYTVTLTITGTNQTTSLTRQNYIYVTDAETSCNTGSITIINRGADVTYDGDFETFVLTSGANSSWDTLPVGNYAFVEIQPLTPNLSLQLVDVVCTDGDETYVPVELKRTDRQVTIPLDLNQHVTCTFYNETNYSYRVYLPTTIKH